MFSGDPKPLSSKASIQGFVPDAQAAWVVVYAGPCMDPECHEKHERLYIVPMVGWLHAVHDGVEFRPAVMTSDGSVGDYLDVPLHYRFVGVLQDTENTIDLAHLLYRKRYGHEMKLAEGAADALMN